MKENNVRGDLNKALEDLCLSVAQFKLFQAGISSPKVLERRLERFKDEPGLHGGGAEEQIEIQKLESASTEDL